MVAAELWSLPVEQVWGGIRDGSIPSKTEHGFMLVDVAPGGDGSITRRRVRQGSRRRSTHTPAGDTLSAAEVESLHAVETDGGTLSTEPAEVAASATLLLVEHSSDPPDRADTESPEEPDDGIPLNWRAARTRTSATRRRPPPPASA